MELIFESVEERDRFFEDYCPSHCALRELDRCRPIIDCERCWEQSGVKYSIKGPTPDRPVSIEEQRSENLKEQVFHSYGMLNPGDSLVKTEHGWRIERKKEEPKRVTLMTHNPYLNVDDLIKPDISPKERWMDKKFEDYVQEVTRGDIQMFAMSGRQFGKSELQRRMLEKYIDLYIFGAFLEKPQIENVIFNGPATIVFWKDGTKTVVKVREGDRFDPEKGLAMAICKKVYGEGYWSGVFKEWVPENKVKSLSEVFKELNDFITKTFGVPAKILNDLPHAPNPLCGHTLVSEPLKPCEDCKHADVHVFDEPCRSCSGNSKFEEKKKEPLKKCEDCKHSDSDINKEPCLSCDDITDCGNFEEKEKKEILKICANCKHNDPNILNDPCIYCGCITRDMFEPKDAK